VVVLDGELQRGAQLMGIERAVAALIGPAGVLLDEGLVADLLPRADARRIAAEIGASAGSVVGGAVAGEAHGHIGIALAGGEAVAHADDEQVADLHILRRHLAAADLDAHGGAGWIGNIEAYLLAARLRDRIAAHRPSARRGEPGATEAARLVDIVDTEDDAVRGGVDVALAVLAGEAVGARIPAGVAEHRFRPAVLVARGQRLLGREDRALKLVGGRQRKEGCAVYLRVGGIGKEAEGIFDTPGDLRQRQRRDLRQG